MIDWLITLACSVSGVCDHQACRRIEHEQVSHVVCSYRMEDVSVSLRSMRADGTPYRTLRAAMEDAGPSLMAMNGGMYHEDLGPVGLYIENGTEQKAISTRGGWGNFHLLPNGVFWGRGGRYYVTETSAYRKRQPKPDFATQSGPMLVIDGKLHPRFLEESNSRKIRNGVGVSAEGEWLHFGISEGFVTFHEFGRLFRDQLDCHNALFLDGSISAIRTQKYRQGGWRDLGPIIVVTSRKKD